MELAQWWLRREGSVLVGAFGRMRMGKLIDDAARVVVTLEGIYVGEAWEGGAHYSAQWYHPHAIRRQSDGHRHAIRLKSEAIRGNPHAITCEPVDTHPSGALFPRPRAVPGIPTVLLRELLRELELAPDEGRNQARSGRSSGAISEARESSRS